MFNLFDVYLTNLIVKLMMVSGGGVWLPGYPDSSEIWNGSEWRLTTGKLPYTGRDQRMAFIDNRILFMGIEARTKTIRAKNKCVHQYSLKRWTHTTRLSYDYSELQPGY